MNLCPSQTTAILLFALSSEEESRCKKIAKGKLLFDTLTAHTIQIAKKTGMPVFHITEDQQTGNSFGGRFTNAIQQVFNQGFEKIITVGNDSPHLNWEHFETALSHLKHNKSVIGPSADGGFYLMGLHRSDFVKSDFEKLSWKTSELKDEIVELLSRSSKEVFLLSTLFDIDSLWDVKVIANNTFGLGKIVAKIIQSLIFPNKKIELPTFFIAYRCYSRIPFNKGSPLHSFS